MPTTRRPMDLAAALRRTGVRVRLGASTTWGLVAPADEETLRAANVALVGRAVLLALAQDSLEGLRADVVLEVLEGPLAGAYLVGRVLSGAGGDLVRVLAFPSEQDAAGLWARGEILLPWAVRSPGADPGEPFLLEDLAGGPVMVLEVSGLSGQGTILTVSLESAPSADGPFADTGLSFEPVEDDADLQALTLPGNLVGQWIRLAPEIEGVENPTATCGAVLLRVAVPRS